MGDIKVGEEEGSGIKVYMSVSLCNLSDERCYDSYSYVCLKVSGIVHCNGGTSVSF